jgi:hypothetical protein
MNGNIIGVITVILLVYIYYIQFYRGEYKKIFNDNLIDSKLVKTGDIICFKAYDNFNSVFMGSYFGHIGIIYIDPLDKDQIPYLFEANGVEHTNLKSHHNVDGIFLTPLLDRIAKYKGRCFWKSLNKSVSSSIIHDFKSFIDYCIDNMSYNYSIITSTIKKYMGIELCSTHTNCGELVFLSLIKLELLPYEYHQMPVMCHLKWMCNIKKLSSDYVYDEIIEIIDHPFKD